MNNSELVTMQNHEMSSQRKNQNLTNRYTEEDDKNVTNNSKIAKQSSIGSISILNPILRNDDS